LSEKEGEKMWFIKAEFWDEFQSLIKERRYENDLQEGVYRIKNIEKFCKEGKGVSFYNRRTINNKLLKELEKYKNDNNYHEYEMDKIKEL